jgi:phage antirepressor YoqD-like protein
VTQMALLGTDAESPFDAIKRTDERGDYWTGRDLQPLMDYASWDKFAIVVEKAKASLALVKGQAQADHHFSGWESDGGRWGNRVLDDYRLTRFGAYLTAMAGDDTKKAVAEARVYFAVRTHQAEIAERDANASRHEIPQSFADALQLAANQARAIEQQNQHIAALEPRAAQADHHRAADGLKALSDFANDLKAWAKREHGVRVLHQEVFDFLGQIRLIIRGETIRKNQPTAFAIEHGYADVKTTNFETKTRGLQSGKSTRLTPAGEGYAWDRAVKRIAAHGSLKPTTDIETTLPRS